MTKTKSYGIWAAIKRRCYNPNTRSFKRYGGRGITMCDRWKDSFEAFFKDMGERPEGRTLDRKDNDGPYSPENCRWATPQEQAYNRERSLKITAFGKTKTTLEWASEYGISVQLIRDRRSYGWPDEAAVSLPPKRGVSAKNMDKRRSMWNS
jgi:hypothetical protein